MKDDEPAFTPVEFPGACPTSEATSLLTDGDGMSPSETRGSAGAPGQGLSLSAAGQVEPMKDLTTHSVVGNKGAMPVAEEDPPAQLMPRACGHHALARGPQILSCRYSIVCGGSACCMRCLWPATSV